MPKCPSCDKEVYFGKFGCVYFFYSNNSRACHFPRKGLAPPLPQVRTMQQDSLSGPAR
uniref:Uracil-DNA glycosylase n=1 Tax=Mesocestoides corti TaxID=53468 RepID=A0A5K3EGN6_MESCO